MLDNNIPIKALELDWLQQLDQQLPDYHQEEAIANCLSTRLFSQIQQKVDIQTNGLIASMLTSIISVQGQISIQELSQQHFLSTRQFQRKFKRYFGISPKKFLNIIRFKQLYKTSILQQKRPDNFLEHGYYDQMHFIRDFQKHLGVNPSESIDPDYLQLHQMAQRNV
ncbi:MAG: helix-turn-helix domain-containing protein [Saprospiraceae bacterium]|nr:helix-turn-helix domain-containing protein [Saprospiraceae bacterium]